MSTRPMRLMCLVVAWCGPVTAVDCGSPVDTLPRHPADSGTLPLTLNLSPNCNHILGISWRPMTHFISNLLSRLSSLIFFLLSSNITNSLILTMADIPNELFAEILSNLPARDLASTSLVTRRLRALSLPLLYRAPHLTTNIRAHGSFQQFLRTLHTPGHTYLGSFLVRLTITWTHDPAIDLHPSSDMCPSELDQLVHLLPLLPRMTGLHLLGPPYLPRNISPRLHHPQPVLPASALQSLRDFTHRWLLPSDLLSTANLLTLLSLPRIRSLDLRQNRWHNLRDGVLPATCTSTLTHLTLRSDQFSVLPLHAVLCVTRALTHLAYLGAEGGVRADMAVLRRALLPVRESLVSLTITLPSHGAPAPSLGGFREWPALRELRCPMLVLVEPGAGNLVQALPRGIRELEIFRGCDWRMADVVLQVVGLLAAKEAVAPVLQRVTLCVGCPKRKRERKELRRAAWAVGVAVRMEM